VEVVIDIIHLNFWGFFVIVIVFFAPVPVYFAFIHAFQPIRTRLTFHCVMKTPTQPFFKTGPQLTSHNNPPGTVIDDHQFRARDFASVQRSLKITVLCYISCTYISFQDLHVTSNHDQREFLRTVFCSKTG